MRSKREELKFLVDLEKWKISNFLYLTMSPTWLKREVIMFDFSKDFSCKIKRLSFMKDKNETAKFLKRFFDLFLKIWKIRAIYKADKMEERVDPCSILISALKKEKTKLFHMYCIFLSIK